MGYHGMTTPAPSPSPIPAVRSRSTTQKSFRLLDREHNSDTTPGDLRPPLSQVLLHAKRESCESSRAMRTRQTDPTDCTTHQQRRRWNERTNELNELTLETALRECTHTRTSGLKNCRMRRKNASHHHFALPQANHMAELYPRCPNKAPALVTSHPLPSSWSTRAPPP